MKIENVAVISLSDYEEYQELKKKKEIDFSRLKTGSKVMLRYTDEHCSGIDNVDLNKQFDVVFFKTKHFITGSGDFKSFSDVRYCTCTFHQDGKFVLFAAEKNTDYITEVIEY